MKRALSAIAILAVSASASAQVERVVEPVPQTFLPIERTEAGVVKAQYIKPGDLSPEAYQALLAEADKIRAYQRQPSYTVIDTATNTVEPVYVEPSETRIAPTTNLPQTGRVISAAQIMGSPTVITASVGARNHTVAKGDTLYSIARTNGIAVAELRALNGLSDNAIQIGQVIKLPSQRIQTTVQPTLSSLNTQSNIFYAGQASATTQAQSLPAGKPYAVLPGDTLYSISRRACVSVEALQGANSLTGNAIQPGQTLALPSGHCLR